MKIKVKVKKTDVREQINDFQYIGHDMTTHIFSYLEEKYLLNSVQLVNKYFYKNVMVHFGRKYGSINYLADIYPKIFPEQAYAITEINKIRESGEKSIIIYKSPLGTGKTAVALYAALSDTNNADQTLVIINTRILSTWLDEVKNFGIYERDPEKSQVLFVHSSTNDQHLKYAKLSSKINNKIVITTPYYIYNNIISANKLTEKILIIVDEAHIFKYFWNINPTSFPKIVGYIFISASPISMNWDACFKKIKTIPLICKKFNPNLKLISDRVNVTNIGGKYAKIVMHHHIAKDTSLDADNLKEIIRGLDNQYKKIVVFSDHPINILRVLAKDLNFRMKDYFCFAFNNKAITHMQMFREKDCVVLCNYMTAIEGVNFSEADCALFFNFCHNSPEKARQCLGRIKRKNNTCENIDVYFLMENKKCVSYVQTRLNQIYAFNDKILLMNKKPINIMEIILKILEEKGYRLGRLTDDEFMLLFSYGNYEFDKLDIRMNMRDLCRLSYMLGGVASPP